MDSATSGRRRSIVIRIVAICVVIAGLAWMIHGVDLTSTTDALARARLWPIVVAAVINFGIIGCKAIAWRILLDPVHRVTVPQLFRYTLASCAASVILPLRAGELVRLWLLRDRHGVPISHGASVAIAEKLLDVVSMLILVAPLPLLLSDVPSSLTVWISALAVGVIAILVVLRALAPRLGTEGWRGHVARAMTTLHSPRKLAAAVAILLVSWLIDLVMIDLVLWAVGLDVPPGAGVLLLCTINLAIAVPSTPGQVGAVEVGALFGLRLLHAGEAESLAFALLYHGLQVIPIVAAGMALGARQIVAKEPAGGGH